MQGIDQLCTVAFNFALQIGFDRATAIASVYKADPDLCFSYDDPITKDSSKEQRYSKKRHEKDKPKENNDKKEQKKVSVVVVEEEKEKKGKPLPEKVTPGRRSERQGKIAQAREETVEKRPTRKKESAEKEVGKTAEEPPASQEIGKPEKQAVVLLKSTKVQVKPVPKQKEKRPTRVKQTKVPSSLLDEFQQNESGGDSSDFEADSSDADDATYSPTGIIKYAVTFCMSFVDF